LFFCLFWQKRQLLSKKQQYFNVPYYKEINIKINTEKIKFRDVKENPLASSNSNVIDAIEI